jgi:hypothetical protein
MESENIYRKDRTIVETLIYTFVGGGIGLCFLLICFSFNQAADFKLQPIHIFMSIAFGLFCANQSATGGKSFLCQLIPLICQSGRAKIEIEDSKGDRANDTAKSLTTNNWFH